MVKAKDLKPGQVIRARNPMFRYLVVEERSCLRLVAIPGYNLTFSHLSPDYEYEVLTEKQQEEWNEYIASIPYKELADKIETKAMET